MWSIIIYLPNPVGIEFFREEAKIAQWCVGPRLIDSGCLRAADTPS